MITASVKLYLVHRVALDLHDWSADGRWTVLQAAVLPQQAAHVHWMQEHLLPVLRYMGAEQQA